MTIDELHDIIRTTQHGMTSFEQVRARKALTDWLMEDRHVQYLSTHEAVGLVATWEPSKRTPSYAAHVMCVTLGQMIDLACLIQLSKGRRIPSATD